MQSKYATLSETEQESSKVSQETAQILETFLTPLLVALDRLLDKRLVRTFLQCCFAMVCFRNSKQGLLLSELGSYLGGYPGEQISAPAGTKRISNLLRSLKWRKEQIDRFLREEAEKEVKSLKEQGKRILCIWDGSVLEKPESDAREELCPVVSSKAKRLGRTKKGLVFNFPAKKAITVTGVQWTGALLTGLEGRVKVALMSWWTTRGAYAIQQRVQEEELLKQCLRHWGNQFLHIFDRGYGTGPWLRVLEFWKVSFVIRWKKGLFFFDGNGNQKKLWQIGQGKKYLVHKEIRDPHTGQKMPCDVWWTQVWHEAYGQPLFLVKVRVKTNVWYLVTNERIRTEEQAWEIVFAYKRRWQIELSFRYGKCELGMESPRLYIWENTLKLLGMVTLVYAFFLHLLSPCYKEHVKRILFLKCQRTDKRCQNAFAPLYRLRWAISRLWSDHRPALGCPFFPDLEAYQAFFSLRC